MSVLIIDDEIDLSLLLKSYFNRKGFDVRLAHSLGDGMQCIESFRPDFLFLDNNLPDGLGWQEAPGIAGKYPSIFQYLISAYHPAVPEMPGHARYKVLEKPISFSDLDNHFHTSTTSENETSPVES